MLTAIWLLIAAPVLAAWLARRNGRSSSLWFLVSLLFTLLVTVAMYKLRISENLAMGLIRLSPLLPLAFLALSARVEASSPKPVEAPPVPASVRPAGGTAAGMTFTWSWPATAGVIAALLLLGGYLAVRPYVSVTRLSAYDDVISRARAELPGRFDHFPPKTQADARLISFRYQPRFWGRASWVARFKGTSRGFVDALRAAYPERKPAGANPFEWQEVARYAATEGEDLAAYEDKYERVELSIHSGRRGYDTGLFISKEGGDAIFWVLYLGG